ncbi:MAG: hypothetical protein CM1200mP34_4080 [Verrucomicrobiales bacterium]|nr:MAG: hypothetical protein CM1200mP34_4080 [Verrucomicrobiales bacterium]
MKEGKVTANKLNVRAGGGERFSIVGRLGPKGDAVKGKKGSPATGSRSSTRPARTPTSQPNSSPWPSRRGNHAGETPEAKPAELTKTDEPE